MEASQEEKSTKKNNSKPFVWKTTTLSAIEDEDNQDQDAWGWIHKHKTAAKPTKKVTLAKQDNTAQPVYSSSDLKGLKVSHALSSVEHETILTLADATIEESELHGDTLASVDIMEKDKAEKKLADKKAAARKGYTGYDDDEFEEGTVIGAKKSILGKYDEEISGPKSSFFVLDDGGTVDMKKAKQNDDYPMSKEDLSQKLKRDFVSLDLEKKSMTADYYTKEEEEAKLIKKKKKNSKRALRKKDNQEDLGVDKDQDAFMGEGDSGSVQVVAVQHESFGLSNKTRNIGDINFVDDDELQSGLERARKLALKEKKRNTDQVVENLKNATPDVEINQGGMVLSATQEFVNNLSTIPTVVEQSPVAPTEKKPDLPKAAEEPMEEEDFDLSTVQHMEIDSESVQQEEEEEEGEEKEGAEEELNFTTEEPLVSGGMAATVRLLSQQGVIRKAESEQVMKERQQLEKMARIAAFKKKNSESGKRKDRPGADHDNDRDHRRRRDDSDDDYPSSRRKTNAAPADPFQDYDFNVDVSVRDEQGNVLHPKEAFRVLCHKFHGMTSGKQKTEKRLMKKNNEMRQHHSSSTDTPLNTVEALRETTAKKGSAHVILSVGNKGVPTDLPHMLRKEAGLDEKPTKKQKEKKLASEKSAQLIDTSQNAPIRLDSDRSKISFGFKKN